MLTIEPGQSACWPGQDEVTLVRETNSEPTSGDLISIPEAARRLGLHAETVYRLCRRGEFSPAIQIGRRWRVSVPRLERYLHGGDQNP